MSKERKERKKETGQKKLDGIFLGQNVFFGGWLARMGYLRPRPCLSVRLVFHVMHAPATLFTSIFVSFFCLSFLEKERERERRILVARDYPELGWEREGKRSGGVAYLCFMRETGYFVLFLLFGREMRQCYRRRLLIYDFVLRQIIGCDDGL